MEYIYSALLLHSAGKDITEGNIKKVLDAVGIKSDDARIKALTASLEGVDINEAISTSVAVSAAAPAPAAGGAPAGEPKKKEEPKEEKKEKKKEEKKVSEEEAAAGLGALFG
ncbi:50S ribosomal protein P1 [[Eubacterium] cellulosolvens]